MSDHDPLCPPPWSFGSGGHCEGCDLIAKARADEREQAGARVDRAANDYYAACGRVESLRGEEVIALSAAWSAARGDTYREVSDE